MTRSLLSLALAFAMVLSHLPASEARSRISIVRDAEIEALLGDYARPLLKAAGLKKGAIRILVANDRRLNAFVSGRNMVVNTGLILQSDTPNEVIGVIAHEIGHIVGGHQSRLAERARRTKIVAAVGSLLGVGIGVAAGASGNKSAASAGASIAASAPTLAMRGFLRYKREEESAADSAAAELLAKTGQSGRGMLKTFEGFRRSLSLSGSRADPYKQSHPMPSARISQLRDKLTRSKHYKRRDKASLQKRHDMARAKIAAYLGDARAARGLLQSRKLDGDARLYGRAILKHLHGSPRDAIPEIDRLAKRQPKNAYVHEMKGEIYLRAGLSKKAIAPLRRAVKLDGGRSGFMRVQLGHALLDAGGKENLRAAVKQLRRGVTQDRTSVGGYQMLAVAYDRLGREGDALLASAEAAYRSGRRGDAKSFAARAKKKLKKGSPAWVRADDILG